MVELKSSLNEYPVDYVQLFDDNFKHLDIDDSILKIFRQRRERHASFYKSEAKLAVCMVNFPTYLFTADMDYLDKLLVLPKGRLYIPTNDRVYNQYKAFVRIGSLITNSAAEINLCLQETRGRREILL